jgi:hypothetical protein
VDGVSDIDDAMSDDDAISQCCWHASGSHRRGQVANPTNLARTGNGAGYFAYHAPRRETGAAFLHVP